MDEGTMHSLRQLLLALAVVGMTAWVTSAQDAPKGGSDAPCQGVIGGAGLYLVTPYFANNPAFFFNDKQNPKDKVRNSNHADIEHNLRVAPQFWLGYLFDCGIGGRARYWCVGSDTSQSMVAPSRVVTAHPVGLSIIADHP